MSMTSGPIVPVSTGNSIVLSPIVSELLATVLIVNLPWLTILAHRRLQFACHESTRVCAP